LGAIIGQIVFGFISDRLGRKRMYGFELIIIIICTFGSAFSGTLEFGLSTISVLTIWRLFLGTYYFSLE